MKRPLVVALCVKCRGYGVDNLTLDPSCTFEYAGKNLCIKHRCPRLQVCGFRCTKHNRSFDLDPKKPRALRICSVCSVNAHDLALANVDMHTYHVQEDVEAFMTALWSSAPEPAKPTPSPLISASAPNLRRIPQHPTRRIPQHPGVRMVYRRLKRRKKPTTRLKHPFHPVVDLTISDDDD
ncbi:hypothetical protein H310_02483 [Aphanomyces invadans]|uniref:Uncharacterized protein n=1 Tax=Aphanomyces invadans TaxID=157072 RepID=A0A024UR95_9STRA|nr:hypothetical protein H310_02483 [Aphanomyces invadans]ETW08143.1 hypothetical protein H310_02483 [Aphanomyces invadans]|eukprot:XP_008864236.1 hypothetical protein H310_02483 [Aphanomyces invadans]